MFLVWNKCTTLLARAELIFGNSRLFRAEGAIAMANAPKNRHPSDKRLEFLLMASGLNKMHGRKRRDFLVACKRE
jgi:hypothetical protein